MNYLQLTLEQCQAIGSITTVERLRIEGNRLLADVNYVRDTHNKSLFSTLNKDLIKLWNGNTLELVNVELLNITDFIEAGYLSKMTRLLIARSNKDIAEYLNAMKVPFVSINNWAYFEMYNYEILGVELRQNVETYYGNNRKRIKEIGKNLILNSVFTDPTTKVGTTMIKYQGEDYHRKDLYLTKALVVKAFNNLGES